jgi:hypothetical protein
MRTNDTKLTWRLRLFLVVIGAALVAFGLTAFKLGHLWIFRENTYTGNGYAMTLGYAWMGLIILIIGLVPWSKLGGSGKR